WNMILPLFIVVALVVVIVVIKAKQNAPLKHFANTLAAARGALREKPDSLYFTGLDAGAKEVPYDPDAPAQKYGEYRLVYDDVTFRFKHERTAEFLDMAGDDTPHVGIQYIEGNPKEIYVEDERVPDPRRFLEDSEGEMMTLRRLVRKHLKLQKADKEKA